MTNQTVNPNMRDTMHWAKKFDKVKHIYKRGGIDGTLCGSSAACLGTNYATHGMTVCTKCTSINNIINKI